MIHARFCVVGVGLSRTALDWLSNKLHYTKCLYLCRVVCKPKYNPKVILCLLTRCPLIDLNARYKMVKLIRWVSFGTQHDFVRHDHALLEASKQQFKVTEDSHLIKIKSVILGKVPKVWLKFTVPSKQWQPILWPMYKPMFPAYLKCTESIELFREVLYCMSFGCLC